MALGLTIVYGVTHIFNFGHGIVAVSGGYFAWLFMTSLGMGMIPAIFLVLHRDVFDRPGSLQGDLESIA
jgi:branched-subunit amino acid ABC-type transport system permease component